MVLVFVGAFQAGDGGNGAHQRDTTASYHAFFDSRTGCVQGIFNAGLLLFHLDLGGSANLDNRNTAGQLGYALLQFLAIVIGRSVFDLDADLADTGLDGIVVTGTIDDGGVVLVH